ncbi:MAG: hypothetical protein HKP41_15095 [Desulfobacterales bacterium]|nr:hypothetical protein [Desulfobacterales bacterium]
MTKKFDITSTEKLLQRIRQDQSSNKSDFSARTLESVEPLSLVTPIDAPVKAASALRPPMSQEHADVSISAAPEKSQKKTRSRGMLLPFSKNKKITIGIELRRDGICLAMIKASSKVIEHTSVRFVPYDTGPFKDEETLLADLLAAPWFGHFLQKQLGNFCGKIRKPNVWCGIPRESVKMHNVTIPKVPQNEIANAVFWSMQKGESFDKDNTIMDFDLVKEIQEDSLTKLLAIVYLARRREIELLVDIFKKMGFTLTGVSTPSVALQNEIRWNHFTCEDESFSRLVLGENKSFIELYYRNTLVFSRDIKTGISSFIDSLMEWAVSRGIILTEEQCRNLILAEDREVASLAGGYGLFTDGETDIFSLDLPAPVRLIRQIERTFDYYQNNFQIPRCSRIYLSGISFFDTGLAGYLSSEIGIPCLVHAPFATLTRPITISQVDNAGGGYRLAASFDMALSEPDLTRNFLVPRAVREKQKQEARVNKISILSTAVILIACTVIFLWQNTQIEEKQASLQIVNSELKKGLFADETQANTVLMTELGKLKENSSRVTKLAERYLPKAVLGQIALSLPPEIKLLRFDLDDQKITTPSKSDQYGIRRITLQGIVTGNRHNMEFILAKYIRKIIQSSFIDSAIVVEKATDIYMNNEVLSFTVQVKAAVDEIKLSEKKKT